MNTAQTLIPAITPHIAQNLQTALDELSNQFLRLAKTDLREPRNLRAFNSVTRAITQTAKLLTPPKTTTLPRKTAPPSPVSSPKEPANNGTDSLETTKSTPPDLPFPVGSDAAVRLLPGYRTFRTSFFRAWKNKNPGLSHSRVNTHLQDLIATLAQRPAYAAEALDFIETTQSHTQRFSWKTYETQALHKNAA